MQHSQPPAADNALHESDLARRAIWESSLDAIVTMDHLGLIHDFNPAAERIFGHARAAVLGQPMDELLMPAAFRERHRHSMQRYLTTGETRILNRRVQLTALRADGVEFPIELTVASVAGHAQPWFIGCIRDITERIRAEQALAASEERYRLLFERNPHPMWIYDLETLRFLGVNDAAIQHYGYSRAEFLEMTIRDIRPREDIPALLKNVPSAYDAPGHTSVWRHRLQDGRLIWAEVTSHGVNFGGRLARTVLAHDVTRRKEAEEQRDRLFNLSLDLLCVGNFDGWLEQVNPAWTQSLGWSTEEVTGRPWLDFVHPDDRESTIAAGHALARGEPSRDFENRHRCKDGSYRWLSWNSHPLTASRQVFAVARDITEQKLSESALADSRRALALLSRCNEALIRSENEGELLATVCKIAVDVGAFRLAWIGYAHDDPPKSVVPQASAGAETGYLSGLKISWSADDPNGRGPTGVALRTGETLVVSNLEQEPGFAPWLESARLHGFRGLVCLPLKDGKHSFGVLVLYMAEVRVPLADEIKLLEELTANLSFGIGSLRAQNERRRIEAAVLQIAGSVSAISNARFFDQLAASMAQALGAQAGFVARVLHGEPLSARTVAAVLDGAVMDNFDYVVQDTPCDKAVGAEGYVVGSGVAQLFPQSTSLHAMGAQAYVGRSLMDSAGQLIGWIFVLFRQPLKTSSLVSSTLQIFASRAASELERQTADTLVREQASLLDKAQDAILVRDLQHRVTYWNAQAERLYGWSAADAIGQSVCDLVYRDVAGFDTSMQQLLQKGEWMGQLTQICKDGRELVVEARWTLLRDETGKPKSVLAINTDITERLALEERLRQSQRLESVGQLTGGVAHDFNNLLTVILGNTELLQEQLVDNPRLAPIANMVVSAAQRGADLTQRLLAFARKQALEPQAVDANQLVTAMDGLLRRTLGEHIDIVFIRGAGLWHAQVDPAQLDNALLNLCLNSRDAMPEGGRLTIETANRLLDSDYAESHTDVAPGPYVMLAVSDSGTGIAAEHMKRVFEPFFTTKKKGKGTGLGLAMIYGFIKQSGGHVSIYSEPGEGTTVKLYLPVALDASVQPQHNPVKPPVAGGSETLLLVEDDALVRRFAHDQLVALGYRVIEAQDGAQALDILRRNEKIDLLFTDVVMPGMSGRELADQARKIRSGLRVLYTSGYTENAIVHHGRLDPGVLLLSKPYRRADLARKIRDALSPPSREAADN